MSLDNIDDLREGLDRVLRTTAWAEQEIEAAQRRHPSAADRIWHSFRLLRPTPGLTRTEPVYRSHCRELLDRVALGHDTRPGTAAECCLALSETSQQIPLGTGATGLYARMWTLAQLPPVELTDNREHYEALQGPLIDELEAWLRTKLRQPWRVLPSVRTPAPASFEPS
jgi:hypothetical protein